MCTRPDRRSVSTSLYALREAVIGMLLAVGVLLLALATGPFRWLRGRRARHLPTSHVATIDVQVHLEDRKCVAELKRVIRQTLRRAARTWAPLPLPIDRVVVGVGFTIGGKVDLYDQFPEGGARGEGAPRPLVVVTLGLREGERELEPAEVAGALAVQIQAVIDERYRQRSTTLSTAAPATIPADTVVVARPSVAARATQSIARPVLTAAPPASSAGQTARSSNGAGLADASLPRLQELLATVQQGQPLDAAGPASNHANP